MAKKSQASASHFQQIKTFDGARDAAAPAGRLEEVRKRARKFREEMLSGSQVLFYKSCELIRVPYPTRYAFSQVYAMTAMKTPLIHILNRLFIVQYKTADGVKTLLFSPSDIDANAETPFFKRLSGGVSIKKLREQAGGEEATFLSRLRSGALLADGFQKAIAPIGDRVEGWLSKVGIRPEQIDYISYDHLHTQDVRRWLGAGGEPGLFPNAKLLITRQEWESTKALLPPQIDWYCPHGIEGVDESKVVFFEGDVRLGEGVALVSTPGHTEGNHSLVAHTSDGLLVTSENGVGPDCYAPLSSSIPAVRKYAKATGMEVVLNGNTLEGGLNQYISMVQEREIAGPSPKNPEFPNVVCSSEFTSYALFAGMTPTYNFGSLEYGRPAAG